MTQKLTYKDVLLAAKKYMEEGRLQCQNIKDLSEEKFEDKSSAVCSYSITAPDGRDLRCALGAALNDSTITRLKEDRRNSGVTAYGINNLYIRCPLGDIDNINRLQVEHDKVAYGNNTLAEFSEYLNRELERTG